MPHRMMRNFQMYQKCAPLNCNTNIIMWSQNDPFSLIDSCTNWDMTSLSILPPTFSAFQNQNTQFCFCSEIIDSKETTVFAHSNQNFMRNPNDILCLINTYPDVNHYLCNNSNTVESDSMSFQILNMLSNISKGSFQLRILTTQLAIKQIPAFSASEDR